MAVRFYNPGSRIHEKLSFDHPINDARELNLIAYWQIEAAEKSFFDVPTEISVNTDGGKRRVSVDFPDRVQTVYRDYGVVRIDPDGEEINEEENRAKTDKEAKSKGDRMWRFFLEGKAREHVDNVNRAKALGVVPTRASGLVKHALNVLGIADPADQVGTVVESNQKTAEIADLQAKLANLERLLDKMTEPKK